MGFITTEKAQRPITKNGTCTYCGAKIGKEHKGDCVLVKKKCKIRMIAEYEVAVPAHWGKDDVESHRNMSSWCANNAIDELNNTTDDCLCDCTKFEYIKDTSEPFLEE